MFENYLALRSEVMWKNFQITHNADRLDNKGYFVFDIKIDGRKSTIIIWSHKVQINYPTAFDFELCFVFLNKLLMENGKSILLESLKDSIKKDGRLQDRFERATIDVIMSLYLELVEGKIEEKMVEQTKKFVKESLLIMLDSLDNIGTED